MEAVAGVIVLSTGGTWAPNPWDRPYLLPGQNGLTEYPANSYAKCVFTDSTGAVVATVSIDVEPDGMYPNSPPSVMDPIRAGTNFVITLYLDDGTAFPIRYGRVVRKDPFYSGIAQAVANPLIFTDNFQRTVVGSNWISVTGTGQMVDNSAADYPDGIAASGTKPAALRFWQEFTTDTVQLGVTVLNQSPTQAAYTGIVLGADVNFSSGLCVQLNAGASAARETHIQTLNGPTTFVDQVAPVADTVSDLDYYLIQFTLATGALLVYKNQDLSDPFIDWTDSAGVVPHGKGYRSFGLILSAPGSGNGIQVTNIAAQDTV